LNKKTTKSGVKIFDDFRDNLIIDRYDPIFATMRGSKINNIRSENSEDALTWNVFRTFRQINPDMWLNRLFNVSFKKDIQNLPQIVNIVLWSTISPPPTKRLNRTDGGDLILRDEGDSEIDIIIDTELFVWFIEAKYRSDISERTTNDPKRNQIIRNIDVGSWYAGIRDFYFSLLYLDEKYSQKGIALIKVYDNNKQIILDHLPHRVDSLFNVNKIGGFTWRDVSEILRHCYESGNDFEQYLVFRLLDWLKKLGH